MPRIANQALPLQDWCVLSLRPRNQHGGLRAAAARSGARTLALSPFAIETRADAATRLGQLQGVTLADAATRAALAQALGAEVVLYTSPNAVAAAAAIRAPKASRGQQVLAVGSGTRRALHRLGVAADAPGRMDSEGLLAMPQLAAVASRRIGLVTGAGGRDRLAPALRLRGAVRLPAPLRKPFARIAVVAASARLADVARAAGFRRIAIATDARPASLLRAAVDAFA